MTKKNLRMLGHKQRLIMTVLSAILVLLTASVGGGYYLYRKHLTHVQNKYKVAYEKHDRVAALQALLDSERYASDLRKAGYTIPSNGEIRYDGAIMSVETKGKIPLSIGYPGEGEGNPTFLVTFSSEVEGRMVEIYFTFNKNLELDHKSYFQPTPEIITNEVSIPKSTEDELLRYTRQEVDDFLKTMYEEIYE